MVSRIEKIYFAVLIILTLAFRLPFLGAFPFVKDEALYAVMVDEFLESPSLAPRYLGQVTEWKPPFAFYVYAGFASVLKRVPWASHEFIYRFPSVLFGLASVFVLYFLAKKLYSDEHVAFLTSLVFSTTALVAITNNSFLLDSLLLLLILLGVYCYVSAGKDARYSLLAGFFFILAFLTKTLVAFAIPFLGVAFFFFNGRKMLSNKLFLSSLASIPFALIFYSLVFSAPGSAGSESFFSSYKQYLYSTHVDYFGLVGTVATSLGPFLSRILAWLPVIGVGIIHHWRKEKFALAWLALTIFPLLTGSFLHWYFLPVIPALSIFAALALGKLDAITGMLVIFCVLLNAYAVYFFYQPELSGDFLPTFDGREVGEFLAGKQNVLVLADYRPEIAAYKRLNEEPNVKLGLATAFMPEHANASFYRQAVYNYSLLSAHPSDYNLQSDASLVFFIQKDWIIPERFEQFDYVAMRASSYSAFFSGDENFEVVKNSSKNFLVVLKRVK